MCCLYTTSSYRKVSRQLRMREAAGDPISLLQDVPSVFPAQRFQQQRVVTANPVCKSPSYSRVNQLQQGSNLPMSSFYCASKATPFPLAEFQPAPRQWHVNQPPSSVWRSQECRYMDPTIQLKATETVTYTHAMQHFHPELRTVPATFCILPAAVFPRNRRFSNNPTISSGSSTATTFFSTAIRERRHRPVRLNTMRRHTSS